MLAVLMTPSGPSCLIVSSTSGSALRHPVNTLKAPFGKCGFRRNSYVTSNVPSKFGTKRHQPSAEPFSSLRGISTPATTRQASGFGNEASWHVRTPMSHTAFARGSSHANDPTAGASEWTPAFTMSSEARRTDVPGVSSATRT